MKSFLLGMLGAALAAGLFCGGAAWQASQRHGSRPFARYEMRTDQTDGSLTIIRLDRITGTLHMVAAANNGVFASDLKEQINTTKSAPAHP